MARKRRDTVNPQLEEAGLQALEATLALLPELNGARRRNRSFRHFPQGPLPKGLVREGEVEMVLPKKLRGYSPLVYGISKPPNARIKNLKYRDLNPEQPFRRFEQRLVTYTVTRKGASSEDREAIYYLYKGDNYETLESLARHFDRYEEPRSRPRTKTDNFYKFSQWDDAYLEFHDFQHHVKGLGRLEQKLGSFGSALRHIIMHHAEMAYHLGLRVREAELGQFQAKTSAVRKGGKDGGRKRAENAAENAKKWQQSFATWLKAEIVQGRVEEWWATHGAAGQRRNSIETLCRYSTDRWPKGGFEGLGTYRQAVKPLSRTLRKIISPIWRQLTSQGA